MQTHSGAEEPMRTQNANDRTVPRRQFAKMPTREQHININKHWYFYEIYSLFANFRMCVCFLRRFSLWAALPIFLPFVFALVLQQITFVFYCVKFIFIKLLQNMIKFCAFGKLCLLLGKFSPFPYLDNDNEWPYMRKIKESRNVILICIIHNVLEICREENNSILI